MRWVTRENAKVDRIACPWLIKNFIDKDAEFIFVPKEMVSEVARTRGATPFDSPGAELSHYREGGEERVSFDAFVRKFGIRDEGLIQLAKIVRGADAKIENPPPESAGLEAAAAGFRDMAKDDNDNMRLQFPLYDALYRFCRLRAQGKARLEHSLGR